MAYTPTATEAGIVPLGRGKHVFSNSTTAISSIGYWLDNIYNVKGVTIENYCAFTEQESNPDKYCLIVNFTYYP